MLQLCQAADVIILPVSLALKIVNKKVNYIVRDLEFPN